MLAPLSHQLPFIQSLQPHYSTNVARVASGLAERYPDLSCIDVGANIGDSVIMLRKQRKFPILCVEPNDRYFAILQHNTRGLADLELEKCLLSDGGAFAGRMLSERGTARLIKDSAAAQTLRTKTLTELVMEHPRFGHAKLLKVDTDGFDIAIVRGALDWLSKSHAAIFLEYDPHLFLPLGDDGLALLDELAGLGYQIALIYENTGDYLLTAELNQHSLLADVHQFFCGERAYCDICLLHKDDAELGWRMRASEIAFFEKQRRSNRYP